MEALQIRYAAAGDTVTLYWDKPADADADEC